jgi:hypothetical protein
MDCGRQAIIGEVAHAERTVVQNVDGPSKLREQCMKVASDHMPGRNVAAPKCMHDANVLIVQHRAISVCDGITADEIIDLGQPMMRVGHPSQQVSLVLR